MATMDEGALLASAWPRSREGHGRQGAHNPAAPRGNVASPLRRSDVGARRQRRAGLAPGRRTHGAGPAGRFDVPGPR
ncbi:hypothetical protein ACRAWD_27010 [Caulobacter segnis]